jgi:SAM-dependent methyltransferase
MKVLTKKTYIDESRKRLVEMNASCLESAWLTKLRRLGLVRKISVGDLVKSWDVLLTLDFLSDKVAKDQPILDIGAYASEVIVALHKLGFTNLTGADLNPKLKKMPFSDSIRYEITDFLHTPFDDASFQAITSISVIEHGFDAVALLGEISRLLMPNGYFIASFDYWPDKIDTTGIKFFDMDWLIFSKADVQALIDQASLYGLSPVGDLEFEADEKPINCADKDYTFGWIVFQKTTQA